MKMLAEPLEIPLVLAGIPGSGKVTVTLAVSTEGDTNPAIEGEDFTIDNKKSLLKKAMELRIL